ncbi:MAG: RNA methyltransferase [Bacteroidia bacterium]
MDLRVRKLKNIELNRLSIDDFKSEKKNEIVVVLDDVRSMNNVGSIFRTCDCLGIRKIYLCGITGRPPHRDIHKTSLGAENSVDWEFHENIETLILSLKIDNYLIVGLEQTDQSKDIRNFVTNSKPMAIIVGNEIEGISDNALAECDDILEIPQFGTKHSFNVAVSCGIALWELINKDRSADDKD